MPPNCGVWLGVAHGEERTDCNLACSIYFLVVKFCIT